MYTHKKKKKTPKRSAAQHDGTDGERAHELDDDNTPHTEKSRRDGKRGREDPSPSSPP
jgi:hypothetical protein